MSQTKFSVRVECAACKDGPDRPTCTTCFHFLSRLLRGERTLAAVEGILAHGLRDMRVIEAAIFAALQDPE